MSAKLEARLTAQALVVEALLKHLFESGRVDPHVIVDDLDAFGEGERAPPPIGPHPAVAAAINAEVQAWSTMIWHLYVDDGRDSVPARIPAKTT